MRSQSLIAITIIWSRPTHPKSQYNLRKQLLKMKNTPGTIPDSSPEIISQADRSYGGTGTDNYMQLDADNSVEQPDPTLTNPRSSKYDLRHNPKPNCNDDYRY